MAKKKAIPFEEAVKILAKMSPAQIEAALAKATPGRAEDMPEQYFINQGGGKYTTAAGPYMPPVVANPEAPNINPAYANSAINITSPAKPSISKAKFVPTTNPAEVPAQYFVQQPDGSIVTVNKPIEQPTAQPIVQTPRAQSQPAVPAYQSNPNLPDIYYMHQPDGTVVQVNNKTGQTTPASRAMAGIGNAMIGKKA